MQQSKIDQSKSFVLRQLDERSSELGERATQTAADVRRIADDLRTSGTVSSAAQLADRGADAIERVGTYLSNADGDALIADAETFARERPWAVASAALIAGFAASRVLRASSSKRYQAYDRNDG